MKNFLRTIDGEGFVDLVAGPPQPKYARMQRAWLVILFIIGICLWGQFLNWGRGPLTYQDWAIIYGPRLAFTRSALMRPELPLHLSAPAVEDGVTLRFFSSPDQILSPQILLLPWLDIGTFILFHYWLMFGLGFWALLLLRRRFGLSLLAFTVLFALFNFNGHILAHTSIGHVSWAGYFLYAVFALLIFDLLDGEASWRWVAKAAFLSLFIVLQGSYHLFIYTLVFLGLLALCIPRRFWWILAAAGFSVLMAAARLLPAALLLGKADSDFISGYAQVESFWQYLTKLQFPNDFTLSGGLTKSTGVWELCIFVGVLGALFILYFGVVRPFTDREAPSAFRLLLVPSLGLALLSMDRVFNALRSVLPFPPITGERVAARILGLAFVFILIGACVLFQRWMDKHRPGLYSILAMLILLIMAVYDLSLNFRIWQVNNAANLFSLEEFDPSLYFPVNQFKDTPYFALLAIGFLISLASAAVLLYMVRRERQNKMKAVPTEMISQSP